MSNPQGAGAYGAGEGPAGLAPVANPSVTNVTAPVRATNYDPSIRDFTLTDGAYDSTHPVDQQVVLALAIDLGSLKSAPTVGNTFRQIKRSGGPNIVADVNDRARLALKRLVDATKISVLEVQIDVSVRSQIRLAVSYVNFITKRVVTKKVTVST